MIIHQPEHDPATPSIRQSERVQIHRQVSQWQAQGLVVLWQVDMQLRQAPLAHHRGQVGEIGYGRSPCLLTHGTLRGGTSDAVAFEGQQNHLLA